MLDGIIRFALTQRLLIVVVTAILVGLGGWAYTTLPIDAYPDISTTQVQVIVKAPSMSPLEVEQRITRPIEVEVRGIPRQEIVRSLTKQALSVITIDFAEGTEIYWARQQVTERINSVLGDLPAGVEGGLAPITSPLSEIFMFMVEGRELRELRSILDWMIRPRLLSVEGVADVNVLGGHVKTFQVEPRPGDLDAFGLDVDRLVEAIQRNNLNAGGDHLVRNNEVLLVRTIGQLKTLEDLAGITVAVKDGVPVHLDQVADVKLGSLTRYGGVTRNGKGEGVEGLVLLRTGANSRQTIEALKARLAEISPSLPEGVTIQTVYDRGDLIRSAVATVESSLGLGVALVLVVLTLFLGNLRSAVTTGIILPLTVLGTYLLMRLFGLTANLMSLGGLAIAVGLLVDASVVVVENIHTKLSGQTRGFDRLHLVYRATQEVARPVFSAVVIIVATFIPLLTLTGVEGKLFSPLALTISFALLVSLVLSLTIIPVISSMLMRAEGAKREGMMDRLNRLYRPIIEWALRRRRWAMAGALIAMAVAASLFLFIGREFLPVLQEGTIVIQTEKIPSISLERSMAIDTQIQRELVKIPEVLGVYSRVGSDELRLDPMGFHQTDSFLVTSPADQWRGGSEGLHARLRAALEKFPWVSYGFTQPIDMRVSEMLTGVRAAVGIKLFGDDLASLEQLSRRIQEVVKGVPGAVDIFRTPLGGQKYLQVRMNHTAMSRMGLSVQDVNSLIETAVGGRVVSQVREANRRIPILVRLPLEARSTPAQIANLRLVTPSGGRVRLGQVALLEEVEGPYQIERELANRVVVIQCNVKDRDVVGFVEELRVELKRKVKLPSGYYITYGGQFENQQRATRRMALLGPGSMFFIFLLLFSTFGSVRQAVLILINVPFALIGGVVALFFSGLYLSVPASVGFIALVGVAIENAVVLVNHFNELRRGGLSVRQAVRQGAERRLRPVLMTAILTILGLVPLLLATGPGSEIQRPLAVVVIGGTFSSLILTLVLLPTLYAWIEERKLPGGGPDDAEPSRLTSAAVAGPAAASDGGTP